MNNLEKHILILTGSPGSGKTTIAKEIALSSPVPTVHLHTDDFWHYIRKGVIPPFLPEAHKQNTVVMNVIAKAAEVYASGSYFVIVDGIIGPWFLESFLNLPFPTSYIVLRPNLQEAIKRCQSRGGETLSDATVITSLHAQLSNLGEFENHSLNVEGKSIPETKLMIEDALVSGKYQLKRMKVP